MALTLGRRCQQYSLRVPGLLPACSHKTLNKDFEMNLDALYSELTLVPSKERPGSFQNLYLEFYANKPAISPALAMNIAGICAPASTPFISTPYLSCGHTAARWRGLCSR